MPTIKVDVDVPEGINCSGCRLIKYLHISKCPAYKNNSENTIWFNAGLPLKCPACLAACEVKK